jgi:6-pyruvoyl-tetrahydropterin synthase related domain
MTTLEPSPRRQAQSRRPHWFLPLLLCATASILILLPFFWFGTASGHDFEFHAASWLDAAYQWKEGTLYPRWTAWTNHGFGEPRFIFYPPLSWMLGALLTLLLPDAAVPMVYVVLLQTLAGLSAYFLLRRLAARRAAIVGALFYTVNPNALLIIYVRSDFAEQLACALFPLLLLVALHLSELLDNSRPSPRTLSLFAALYAAVWLSNAPAGVIASYSLALLIAWAALTGRSWTILMRGSAALALGLALAAFYLIPAAYEQRWVNIGEALSSGLLPWQNFLFTAIADVEHTWFNWIASICALWLILTFALAALFSGRFSTSTFAAKQERRAFTTLLVTGSAATALTLRWTLPLWNLLPKLRFVQFPWRWMSIIALVAVCFLAALADTGRGWVWIVLLLALSLPLASFLISNTWWDQDEMPTMRAAITTGSGFDGTDEYDPIGDAHLDLGINAPLTKILPADSAAAPLARVQVQRWQTEKKEILVDSPAPARLALRLLNYPAWRVTVNARPIQPERLDDVNQMVVPVNAGRSEIRVRFTRTLDRKTGDLISLLTALLLLALSWRRDARRRLD